MVQLERYLSPAWVRALLLAGLALALSLVMYEPALANYPVSQGGDGPMFHRMVEAGKVSIARYHELPLWNAYECGGAPLWDNPESIVAAPLILLMQPLNTTLTMRIWYVVHHAIGFIGMWLFARHDLRLSRGASLTASVIFALTVAHGSQYAGGHSALVGFLYAPLALLLWRRAEGDLRYAVGLGLLYAWMFYEGAPYPVPHIALLLGAEALTRAWPAARLWQIVRAGLVFVATFVCVGAARLLPVAYQLSYHARTLGEESDAIQWKTLVDMYLAKSHEWHVAGQTYVWGEYIAYLGILVVALALVGVALTRREEAWLLAVGLLMFALMLGHFSKYAPWHFLREHVFPFRNMRVPVRFRLIFLLFIAGWVGFAIDRLPKRIGSFFGRRIGEASRVAVLGLGLIGAGDAMGYSSDVVRTKFDGPIESHITPSDHLYFGGQGMAQFIDQPRQNRGRLDCWGEWSFTAGAPQWQGDVPQARSTDPKVVVESSSRTQNTFTLDVDASAPGRVLVNVPFDPGWRTDVGTIADENKLLVVDVPAGHSHVRLKYWPHGLTLGLVLTALGLAASIAFFVLYARRARLAPTS